MSGTDATRQPSSWPRRIGAIAAGAMLFAPAVAFVAGARGKPIENRASVEFTGVDSGWDSFVDFGAFLADRLPLRENAVESDAWIDEHVFHEDPAFGGGSSPRVVRGEQGFLFLADAIDAACAPNAPPAESVEHLHRLASIIADSGREVLMMVAPDKSSVHPELLPADLAKRECFDAYADELWSGLDAAAIPGYVDLRDTLRTAVVSSREALYLRKDSHWDNAGSLVAVQAAIDRLAPGLWDPAEVAYRGLGDYTGDLTGLQGNPEVDQAPMYSVERRDITSVSVEVIDDIEGEFNRRFVNSGPPGRLIPGKTLMFLDSYGLTALPQIVPFFEDLTIIRLVDFPVKDFVPLIADADRVWMMTVERSMGYRLSFEIGLPEFLDRLEAELPKRTAG